MLGDWEALFAGRTEIERARPDPDPSVLEV